MGKNMNMEQMGDKLDHINPSCMWGIMHVIDYHHWHCNVKRLLSHGKNQEKRAKSHGSPKRRATHRDSDEMHMLLHEEERVSPVDRTHKGSASINKRSLKTRIKALIADQTHKEGNDKGRGSRLERTQSIHHLEPSDHGFSGGTKNLQNPTKSNITRKPYSEDKRKEQADALEMLKVKKDLFLEIFKNADNGIKKISRTMPASNAKSRLSKSGSFPSQRRNLGSSKLKHKQNEIWPAPLGEKYSMDSLYNSKNFLPRSVSSSDSSSSGIRFGRALSLILQTTMESDNEGLKEFGVEEGNKETNSSLSVLGEVSNGEKTSVVENDFAESSADSRVNRDDSKISSRSCERDDVGSRNSTFSYRRSSSLSESLDKYTSLFENNFRKEVKLRSSKSLRLSNENENRSGKSNPAIFKRIRSLSQQDEFYSFLENVVQVGGIFGDWPIKSVEETATAEDYVALDETKVPENQTELIEKVDGIQPADNSGEFGESITDECRDSMENLPENNPSRDEETNNSESSNNFQDEEASSIRELFRSSEGLESRYDNLHEDSSTNLQDGIDRVSSSLLDRRAVQKYDTDLEYVRDLLERSGFTKNALKWKWHSLDQPLSPSVFEETEANWHQELECTKEEDLWRSCYHHHLLFELVNEVLASLYDGSYTYYPKPISSSCHVRRFPLGDRLLQEIFSQIMSLMSLKPEQMESLDSVIGLDLKKNDGWMNLQVDSEDIALDIEDMIFDELLEELF